MLATSVTLLAQPRPGLTGAPRLARVYDAIFDADFEQVPALSAQACGPSAPRASAAPAETCQLLDVVAVWWQIQIDPDDTARDGAFQTRADAAIAAMEAWTQREPQRAEAWFYLGGAYGARAQWRVLRGERLAAARDGKRIKDALERALVLDPALQDAYFGIGLYHYYADVAPAVAKFLRWLLLLPGGDRVQGMQEMQRARTAGQLLHDEADYQLHVIELWYEKRTDRALDLLRGLGERHPRNGHFVQREAEIEDVYLHDTTASLRSWQRLFDAARARRVAEPAAAEARARVGLALQFDRLFETDLAVDHLRAVVDNRPLRPFGILALAQLRLGQALDRLGSRGDAVAAYQAVLRGVTPGDPLKIGAPARAGLRNVPDADTALAYRLSIEGWRAFERGALADAGRGLSRSLALRPADRVTRYRQARLLDAQDRDDDALAAYEGIVASRAMTPPTFYASACVDAARLHEARGATDRAIELYRIAHDVFGADRRTRDAADRALARLTATAATQPR